mmetsp:Transcript_15971/g.24551  ORF Transcript_15971/g.24551 Transcript_15971/m.24551 type:complete len:105 (-) Transcript_15971:91-405(-)
MPFRSLYQENPQMGVINAVAESEEFLSSGDNATHSMLTVEIWSYAVYFVFVALILLLTINLVRLCYAIHCYADKVQPRKVEQIAAASDASDDDVQNSRIFNVAD